MTSFADWLRGVKKSLGLTNEQIGQRVGITGTAVGYHLNGQNRPDRRQLDRYAVLGGVRADYLYALVDGQQPAAPDEQVPPEIAELMREIHGLTPQEALYFARQMQAYKHAMRGEPAVTP